MTTKHRSAADTREALAAFVARKVAVDARKVAVDAMLQRLAAFSDEHFGVAPDEVTWGHVGDLSFVAERLRHACDFIFQEGDCAG